MVYVTELGYDDAGRLARVKDPLGTITRTAYTETGKVRMRQVGTNDYAEGDPLGEDQGPNDMTTVEQLLYDYEEDWPTNVGEGNVTYVTRWVSGSSSRDMAYTYDWRSRRTVADGEESYLEKTDYDNLDRPTVTYRYNGTVGGALLAKSEREYDALGRVFRSTVYEVVSGSIDDALVTDSWYDARGNLIKVRLPGGSLRKTLYDAAQQVVASYVSIDTSQGEDAYAAASTVTDDTVISQVQYERDAVGNVLLETTWAGCRRRARCPTRWDPGSTRRTG